VVNFAIIYTLAAITPETEVAKELNLFKLDCLTIANLASVNLSINYSRNLNSSLLDKYANSYLDLHPKYFVKIEIEKLENGKKWVIGDVPEELPEQYKDFKTSFVFPVLIEGSLGKLNITCAKRW
jgi:hypothetical protein